MLVSGILFLAATAQAQVKTTEQKEKIITPTEIKSIGPKQDDPRKSITHTKKLKAQSDSTKAIGPKQDDPRKFDPNDPQAIGPKQDDPGAMKRNDTRAIGPKQDDPRAKNIKQTDSVKIKTGAIREIK